MSQPSRQRQTKLSNHPDYNNSPSTFQIKVSNLAGEKFAEYNFFNVSVTALNSRPIEPNNKNLV